MKITKISYGETVNLGNYESARIDFEAEVDGDKEDLNDCLMLLKTKVKKEAAVAVLEKRR